MVEIFVCVKVIIDPEMPSSAFKVDRGAMKPIQPVGVPPLLSPFDENALEAALRIKDGSECKVTALSVGKSVPKALLQKILAVGVDEVICVEGIEFENLDAFNSAVALSSAIKKIGHYDLIFMGRQSADWDGGLVWAGVAELLNIPSITIARKAEVRDGKVIVERCVSDGTEILEVDMPALVTFSSEGGELRHVPLQRLIMVKKLSIPKWSASELGFKKSDVMVMKDLYESDLSLVDCHVIPGETGNVRGRNLARELFEHGIILNEP